MEFSRELESPETDKFTLSGVLAIDNTTSYVFVGGEIRVRGPYDCDRCLEIFDLDYTAVVDILIQRVGFPGPGDESDTYEIHQQRGVVDLSEALREAAMIGWPLHTVCSDACRGYCAECGQNLNKADCKCEQEAVDPRWDNLPDD
jgi:DUF177 domain-containing protein